MFSPSVISLLTAKIKSLPAIIIERSLRRDIDELVAMALPFMRLAIVDDVHTSQALGEHVFKALKGRFASTHITLPVLPVADDKTAQYLHTQTLSADALVAVGSGTIADLCKYVSFKSGKPYVVFPTAASMNGYLSANASITVSGHKKTFPAHMPKAVCCDLSVVANAPVRLSKSGLGDSLARPTAQADWLLSHLILGTAYDETPFQLLAEYEPQLFDNARGIAKSDPESIALLMKILMLSGLGMTIAGGSYPASGGEHMIAHAMEMALSKKIGTNHQALNTKHFHGEAIGVTTLTMARVQEKLLRGKPQLRSNDFDEVKIAALYGEAVMKEAKEAFARKYSSPRRGEAGRGAYTVKQSMFERECPLPNPPPVGEGIREKISPITIPPTKLEAILKAAEAPTTPEELGWNEEDYSAAISTARYLRERFTFMDLQD